MEAKKILKPLSLKKETLLSLQEKQMQSVLGGEALYTSGETAGCPSSDCNGTCCKKSCKGGGGGGGGTTPKDQDIPASV